MVVCWLVGDVFEWCGFFWVLVLYVLVYLLVVYYINYYILEDVFGVFNDLLIDLLFLLVVVLVLDWVFVMGVVLYSWLLCMV